jgi:hypothetical protein
MLGHLPRGSGCVVRHVEEVAKIGYEHRTETVSRGRPLRLPEEIADRAEADARVRRASVDAVLVESLSIDRAGSHPAFIALRTGAMNT